jgi:predicted RNA-binding Zn ribbon-like protein
VRHIIKIEKNAESLNPEAGQLCLDYANTAEWHASNHPEEHLNSYSDLVAWAQQAGIFTEEVAQHLLQEAARRSVEATIVLERAIVLREAIYRIFSAVAAHRSPEASDLAILNIAIREAFARLQLIASTNHFSWQWTSDDHALDQMLWSVARSAADLLTSDQLDRVGECADDRGCGWLFFDTSRNHSRRWCDMKGCGNRAKARQHYKRKQLTS